MPLQVFDVSKGVIGLDSLFDYCDEKRARYPEYARVCNRLILDSYQNARKSALRYNRKTHVMRDNKRGILARPSNPSEWSEAAHDDACEYLMRQIWCDAVRAHNVTYMA